MQWPLRTPSCCTTLSSRHQSPSSGDCITRHLPMSLGAFTAACPPRMCPATVTNTPGTFRSPTGDCLLLASSDGYCSIVVSSGERKLTVWPKSHRCLGGPRSLTLRSLERCPRHSSITDSCKPSLNHMHQVL